MATAKKLPSGSWRCLVYSHTEKVFDHETGKFKNKRIYKSFTSDDPSKYGRKRVEEEAAAYRAQTDHQKQKQMAHGDMTVRQAVDEFIASRERLGRSATTIQGYRSMTKECFPDLMDMKLKDISEDVLKDMIELEASRSVSRSGGRKTITAKTLRNEWGLISGALHRFWPQINFSEIDLPGVQPRSVELPTADVVFDLVRGTDIELPVLLAMWLSFSMSEIRGLTRSASISSDGNYIYISQVMVVVDNKDLVKEEAKVSTRKRMHRLPEYIKGLIEAVPGDVLVPMTPNAIYKKWIRLQKSAGLDPISFHSLRAVSASVMALLHVPDKYAQERGGWKTDTIMKRTYMQTFSQERVKVDDMIDSYFEGKMTAMQHEMQHEIKKAP